MLYRLLVLILCLITLEAPLACHGNPIQKTAVSIAANDDGFLYKVIGVTKDKPATGFGVMIDNKDVYRMSPIAPGSILYQVNAPKATVGYKYVQLDRQQNDSIIESEPFTRSPSPQMNGDDDDDENEDDENQIRGTLNEFYGRSWTYRSVSTFNTIDSFPQDYNRSPADTLHPTNEIPSMHVQAPASDIDRLHGYYLQDIDIKANITYITSKKVIQLPDAKFKLGGRSSRFFTKFSYNVHLPKHTDIDGFRKLKLRSCASDPTYMREKIAYDMLSAAGRPASRTSYVRLFINNRAVGLFLLLDKYDDNWLENEFNGGESPTGILYQGEGIRNGTGIADLAYHGDKPSAYENNVYEVAEKSDVSPNDLNDFTDLISFIKFIDQQLTLQKSVKSSALDATVDDWEKQFDCKGFFINIALDFLMGNYDDYVQNTNNYFLYKDPVKKRFVLLNWDMDLSMGSGPVNMKKVLEGDYRKYVGMDLRPLTKATFMTVPSFRKSFENRLSTLVHELFHPNKSFPVIDSLAAFIKEDVAWDTTLPRMRKGASMIPFGPHNIENWLHHNGTGAKTTIPLTVDYLVAIDFIARVNSKIPFDRAIQGRTHHSSLYSLKDWFKIKTEHVLPFISSYK